MAHPGVVIIGAGVGGLTLALLLRQRGINAEVLEQSAELKEVGAAVALAANGVRVLRHLGLGDSLAQVSTEPSRLIHRDGRDGRPVATTPDARWYRETFGAPFAGLHRMGLQRLLAGAFGPDHLHLGCRVTGIDDNGSVRCASGATIAGAVVVGADGVHSVARNWVAGADEPVYSGTSGFRGLVPAEKVPSLPDPGALQFWMGPGAHLLHYPISGGRDHQLPGRDRRAGPLDRARLAGAGARPVHTWSPSRAGIRPSPRCSRPCRSPRAGACSPAAR